MVLKNERVKRILELIEKFCVCDVTHIARLFYLNNKFCIKDAQNKLTALVKEKTLCRKRNDINSKYFYYIPGSEPSQINHKLILVEFYTRLCAMYGIDNIEITREFCCLGLRADAYIKIAKNKRLYLFFVEVQISNNPCDIQKYENAFIKNQVENIFPKDVFPSIIFITDQKPVQSKNLNLIFVNKKIERCDIIEKTFN